MAESPDHEIQMELNAEQKQGQGDVPDDTSVDNDTHIVRGNTETPPYRPRNLRPNNDPISSSKPHRLHVKPEPLYGSSDWEVYLSHFINCAELSRWTNQDTMLGLSANIRGPARIFYMSFSQDERADYYRLVDELAQRFRSVKQQQGESIAALGDDIRQMAQKARYTSSRGISP